MRVQLIVCALCVVSLASALTHCDVAVVGGGSGGASTAVFLQDKGYHVCLFEKESILGGHCNTEPVPDAPPGAPNWIDLGVQIYSNTTMLNEMHLGSWLLRSDQYIGRFVPPGFIVAVDFTTQTAPGYAADLQHGEGPLPTSLSPAEQQAVAAATQVFVDIVSQYPWLEQAGQYPDPIPPELLVPFSEFITTNNLEVLAGTLFAGLTFTGGMGSYDQLTTLYALENMHLGILELLQPTKSGLSLVGGCQTLYQGITAYLGSSVYLDATILSIRRPAHYGEHFAGPTQLHVRLQGESRVHVFEADRVVIAIPQTRANLEQMLDLDERETGVFDSVRTRSYFALEFDVAGPIAADAFRLTNVDTTQAANLPLLPTLLDFERVLPYGPSAGWASSDAPIAHGEMIGIIESRLAKMPPAVLTSVNLTRFIPHVFQPYFSRPALAASPTPYTRLQNLQGYRNTFYVGALPGFAESVKIWEHAFRLIQQNF